jgi:hypothetical protein
MGVLLSCLVDYSPKIAKQESQFYKIRDQYKTMAHVQEALQKSGLESSQLIIGILFGLYFL